MRALTTTAAMVLQQLAGGEKRLLSLVVAVRKARSRTDPIKGDLTDQVKCALRQLVAAEQVKDQDGLYSLARHA